MALVKGGLAGHGAIDRDFGKLGELLQFGGGVGHQDAHTGPDDRLFGVEEQVDGFLDVGRFGGLTHPLGRVVVHGGVGDFLAADVGGDFDDDRAGASVAQGVEGAAHDAGDLAGLGDDLAELGDGGVGAYRGEVGFNRVLAQGRAAGQVKDGHVVAVGLGQAAHGVFGAGAALGDGYAELPAAVEAAEAVGGHEGAAFLAEHDGADALLGDVLDELVGGEAGNPLHAFEFEDSGHGLHYVHIGLVLRCG